MQFKIKANKTYKTEANAVKAVQKTRFESLPYFIMQNDEGRFFPVFVGQRAVQEGVHFFFNIVA